MRLSHKSVWGLPARHHGGPPARNTNSTRAQGSESPTRTSRLFARHPIVFPTLPSTPRLRIALVQALRTALKKVVIGNLSIQVAEPRHLHPAASCRLPIPLLLAAHATTPARNMYHDTYTTHSANQLAYASFSNTDTATASAPARSMPIARPR